MVVVVTIAELQVSEVQAAAGTVVTILEIQLMGQQTQAVVAVDKIGFQ